MAAPRNNSHSKKLPRVCFSFAAYAKNVINHLKNCQVPVIEGLTDQEFSAIESSFKFIFPPDLRSILQEGLPVGIGFPNWRSSSPQQLQTLINLPISCLCYQISKGKLWFTCWGSKPSNPNEAVKKAKSFLENAPILVPIYSYFYIPSNPNLAGNPVLFIHSDDFHYSGFDVADFFQREAFVPDRFQLKSRPTVSGKERKKVGKNQVVPARKSLSERPPESEFSPDSCEPMVRSAGNSPRNGTVSPGNVSRFTIQAPAWVAKAARRIEFWSDLVEGPMREMEHNISTCQFEVSKRDPEDTCGVINDTCRVIGDTCDGTRNRKWVEGYLVEMERRLRSGGWKEDDIREMMTSGSDGGFLKEEASLVSRFKIMATALRNAGWSAEVVNSLGFDAVVN